MTWAFNPFTGTLDKVGDSAGAVPKKKAQVVDASFLATPEIELDLAPLTESEIVTLNGLEIDDSNYNIVSTTLTMATAQLEEGDLIYVNYLG